jgi:hypothetical protein
MNFKKEIEKFIDNSIKSESAIYNDQFLLKIFYLMNTHEIYAFWNQYVTNKTFSSSNTEIDHWKTKDQETHLKNSMLSLAYYGDGKDSNNQIIINRNSLIEHVRYHIKAIIEKEISKNKAFRNQPFLEKLKSYLVIAVFISLPVIFMCFLLQKFYFFQILGVICISIYPFSLVTSIVINLILRNRSKRQF